MSSILSLSLYIPKIIGLFTVFQYSVWKPNLLFAKQFLTGFFKICIDKWSEYVIKQKRRCCFKLHLLLHSLNLRNPKRDLVDGLRHVLLFPSIRGLFCSYFYALFLRVFEPFSDNFDAFGTLVDFFPNCMDDMPTTFYSRT